MLDMEKTDSANPIELPQLSYRYRTICNQIPLIRSWLMMELIWIQLLFLSSACCFPGPHHIFQVFTWTNPTPKVKGRSHINLQYSSTHLSWDENLPQNGHSFEAHQTSSLTSKNSLRDWKIELCSWLVCCRVRLHKQKQHWQVLGTMVCTPHIHIHLRLGLNFLHIFHYASNILGFVMWQMSTRWFKVTLVGGHLAIEIERVT